MLLINQTNNTEKPKVIEYLGNGTYYYNFNIVSNVVFNEITNCEETIYNYNYVRIVGTPNISNCFLEILKNYKNEDGVSLETLNKNPNIDLTIKDLVDKIYYNLEVDFGIKEKKSEIDLAKDKIINLIDKYDTSPEVNSFYLNDLLVWLDKATRVGLMNSLVIEKDANKNISTLWFGNTKLEIEINTAINMLKALELYALTCYNKTSEHKVAVKALTSLETVENYDYTTGYPTKLNFTIE